jgi:cation:H+ antiporter
MVAPKNYKKGENMEHMLFPNILALISGLMLLWWSGDRSVHYSLEASHLFGVSSFFMGFVLLALATGIPELSITIVSSFNNASALAVGDILGSNFTDIALVLGLPLVIAGTLHVRKKEYANLILMLLIIVLVMSFVFILGELTWIHGVILIVVYALCLLRLWKTRTTKTMGKEGAVVAKEKAKGAVILSNKIGTLFKLGMSLVFVGIASQLSVYCARALTEAFDIHLATLGATLFSLGTSLPELSLSLSAIRRREYALAAGNSLGSVLEQGTLILGILAIISPTPVNLRPVRSIAPFMFLAFAIVGYGFIQRKKLNRIEGIMLLVLYVAFLVYHYAHPYVESL